ncbi:OmpA family protein [Flavobacterium sp.]|uniref:OmpA family protein n=1 Tax=Flavobacterium sp. TaxID=239 RepID=UPI003752EAEB
MKKIFLTAAAVFAFGFANAQEKKESTGFGFTEGNVLVEGNLSFGSGTTTDSFNGNDNEEVKESNLSFNPKVGYFFSDKFAFGVELNVLSGKTEETIFGTPNVVVEEKQNGFGAGVFARYYFLNLGQRFKTYTEASLGFASIKNEVNGTETSKGSGLGLNFDLGINYFVTENIAINFGLANVLGYNSAKIETPAGQEVKVNELSGNLNLFKNFFETPTFGLTFKF